MHHTIKLEFLLYLNIWITAVLYSIYSFAKQANFYFQDYIDEYSDFSPGWSFLNRRKDVSDYEWETVKYLIKRLYFWMIFNIFTTEILRKFNNSRHLQYGHVVVSIIVIICELNIPSLVIILLQPFIFLLSMKLKRSIHILWLCNIMVLSLITLIKSQSFNEYFLKLLNINDKQSYMLTMIIFWMNLKCFSYNFDCLTIENSGKSIDFLAYSLYLPTLFYGPFIKYDKYQSCLQHQHQELLQRCIKLIINVFRLLFWIIFVEFCLHYIYVNAISFHPEWVEDFNSWSLYGYGYTMGQFFHIKYVVMYGLSTSLAQFDGVQVPKLPICIGRVHLYSDMWKYFDVGLYEFLVSYIYIPSIRLIRNRLIASFLCFLFVYIWHGIDFYILLWTCFNYFAICVEVASKYFYREFIENSQIKHKFSANWMRRFCCILASPLLAFSVISNFYFFARLEIGNVFLTRILNDSWYSTLILMMILYCCCQVSTELRIKLKTKQ